MAKFLAVALVILGGLLASRGLLVWNGCGYDCGIFAQASGFTATASTMLGFILLGTGMLMLLGTIARHLRRGRYRP